MFCRRAWQHEGDCLKGNSLLTLQTKVFHAHEFERGGFEGENELQLESFLKSAAAVFPRGADVE